MQETIAGGSQRCVAALVEKADTADKPGKREDRYDAHAKHEFESLSLHIGDGTATYGTLPCYYLSARIQSYVSD